jgi:hypothetical protein
MTQMQRIRRALKLYRSEFAPKELRKANARQWLAKTEELGERALLRGGEAKWGINLQGAK